MAALPWLKGTLDILVLKALSWRTMHGFEIATWLDGHSGGDLAVDDGALYQALHRMEARRLIGAEWGVTENNRRARYYSLTPAGRRHLRQESATLVQYARTLTAMLAERGE
jgi:PadR family transcriptional regulator PadR